MSLNGVKAADVSETQAKNIILKSTNAAGTNISLADIIKVELKDVLVKYYLTSYFPSNTYMFENYNINHCTNSLLCHLT